MTSLDRRNDVSHKEAAAPGEVRRWRAFALLAVAYFMTVVDLTIVNVALPTIGRKLHFPESDLQWVVTAYALTFGGFLLLGGRAADLLGRRRMFMAGLAHLHRGLARLRAGHQRHVPDRHARRPGPGRRGGAARRAVDRDEHVRRGRRAQQGARRSGAASAPAGATVGVLAGGAAHPVRRLAVHLLPERRRSARPRCCWPGGWCRKAGWHGARRRYDPLGAITVTGALVIAGLRDLAGADRRVDRRPDPGPARGVGGPAGRASWSSRPGPRRRCCRCGCSG